jgi:hypothetical protein
VQLDVVIGRRLQADGETRSAFAASTSFAAVWQAPDQLVHIRGVRRGDWLAGI